MTENIFIKIILAGLAYFSAIHGMIILVLIFVIADFCSGVYASYIEKKPIISSKLRKSLEKFVIYGISIMLAYGFQKEVADWTNLGAIVAGFIAVTELLSIYENVYRITGINLVTYIKDILSKFIKK